MARRISDEFINDLLQGELSEILEYVKSDDTLDLEFRKTSIIIYYRGGKLLEVKEKSKNSYEFLSGDDNYNPKKKEYTKPSIKDLDKYIPQFKYIIDLYFGGIRLDNKDRVRFSLENEIRQHIVRENNFTNKADQTDYFIIDTEYQTKHGKKFDIVAIEWEASSTSRKLQKKYTPKIVIFELKYAEDSIKGKCGLGDHLKDFEMFKKNEDEVKSFKSDMLEILKHKRELGLIEAEIRKQQKYEENMKIFTEIKSQYFGLKFSDSLIQIIVLESIEAYKAEGKKLKHCVYSSDYFAKPESLILSARINDEPIETVEVSLKNFKVLQCRGLQNSNTEYHDRIIELVHKNRRKFNQIKRQKVLQIA